MIKISAEKLAEILTLSVENAKMREALEAAHNLIQQVERHGGIIQYYGGYRAAKLVREAIEKPPVQISPTELDPT